MSRLVGSVVELVRRGAKAGGTTDTDLLRRFVATREEEAFAALVRRHGPLVWGVCRRLLTHTQDAEDAFQATFLVLACKAGAVGRRGQLANWLFGVARRAALGLRRGRGRRARREVLCGEVPDVAATHPDVSAETRGPFRAVLDEELARLPNKYRLPLLLCCLQGLTHAEAGRQLAWPVGTVAGRLSRGRALLRQRLQRRGVDVAGAALVSGLAAEASAAVPAALAANTARHAVTLAKTGTLAAALGAHVPVLLRALLRQQAAARATMWTAAVLGVAVVLFGALALWAGLPGGSFSSGYAVAPRLTFTPAAPGEAAVARPEAPRPDAKFVRLPADPGAVVVRLERTDTDPKKATSTITVRADGRVEAEYHANAAVPARTFTDQLRPTELQEIMQFVVHGQELFDLDRDRVLEELQKEFVFTLPFKGQDTATTEVHVRTADREHTVRWPQLGYSAIYFRKNQRVNQLLAVERRLTNLLTIFRAGGRERAAAAAATANGLLRATYPKEAVMTGDNLTEVRPTPDVTGTRYYFERGDKFNGPTYFQIGLDIPAEGNPHVAWITPQASAGPPSLPRRVEGTEGDKNRIADRQ